MAVAEPVFTGQGTRLSDTAPWITYASEMDEKLDPKLAKEVAEYAKRYHDPEKTSNQNKEELARQKELSDESVKEFQFVTPEEYEDIEQRIGRVMHSAVFINKLRSLGITCWYTQHLQPQKATLIVQDGVKEPEVACWVQQGYMPELSIMRFDEHKVPVDERRRGWRTCLLQLILKGIISETQANITFGNPGMSPAFDRYNSTLYEFRKTLFK